MMDEATPSRTRVRVWDVPTRLFHWLLVICFAVSWWTGKSGRLEWHRWSGYALLALLAFRIYWGFFGSSTARFRQFVRGPRAIAGYLRGAWSVQPGHSPLGGLSVMALLILLGAQIVFGLFAVDVDGIESGPLSLYVTFETGRAAAELHEVIFNLLLSLIGLHIAAIAYYWLVRKEDLLAAMFHGTRAYSQELPPVRQASMLRFLIGAVLAAALTWCVSRAFQVF